jgi:1-acyl-sn-glycerol-3-phosphate acyltransferase
MKSFARWFMNMIIRIGTTILCRIDKGDFPKVPLQGPIILVTNHINALEVPLLFVHLQPRELIGLAKIETWDSKFMGWLFDLWDAIPIRRGEADLEAIRRSLGVLKAGKMLAISPEGTRSYDGQLIKAQPGIAMIALHSGVPIVPMAHWGGEDLKSNLKKLRRTDFHVRVGASFFVDVKSEKVNSHIRQEIADEIMGQIAALMPEKYHGEYSGKTAERTYLKWA